MNDKSPDIGRGLDQRLAAEAKSLREMNGFSPLLHERIMSALRRQGLSGKPVHVEPGGSAWRFAGWLAAAAAVIAIMALIVFKSARNDTPKPPPPIVRTQQQPPKLTTAQLDPASNAIDQRKFAYLDRDANHLLNFVSKQIPIFPNVPQK